jgi:hypothetical protein
VREPARERGGVRPCGEEFSAGLIFLCFVSFYQACPVLFREKEMKRVKVPLPNKYKVFTFLLCKPDPIQLFDFMNGLKLSLNR